MTRKTKLETRAQTIQTELLKNGKISVGELAEILEVSVATVRRDLAALQKTGGLRRTHGGAISLEPLLYEPFRHDATFQGQIEKQTEEKRRIGIAAAALIEDGDVIALTAGTTTTYVARSIRNEHRITLVTSTVNVAMELSGRSNLSVIVTGGMLHGSWFSLIGPPAIHAMSQLVVDKVFLGVDGLSLEHGLTTFYLEEAALNAVMIRQAKQRIVVADHTKFHLLAHHVFGSVQDVNLLVTGIETPASVIDAYRARGVDVRQV